MNIKDFIEKIEEQSINTALVEKIEEVYEMKLADYVKKLLSASLEGEFFDSDGILRLLSHKEILNASEELSVDFNTLKIVPIFDTGDNDYIVFDVENNNWCKFNIVDSVKFKQRQLLKEFFK